MTMRGYKSTMKSARSPGADGGILREQQGTRCFSALLAA